MSLDVGKKEYIRPHDPWQCSIDNCQSCGGSGIHRGVTEECVRQPSLRMQRGIFSAACTMLVIGVLMACLTGPNRNEFFAPGPLTKAHAQILVGSGSNHCSSCHGAGDKSLSNWIQDAIKLGKHIPVSQSSLCMDCHDKSLSNEFAMVAHNVSTEKLDALTSTAVNIGRPLDLPDPRNSKGDLACATCHREHHGAEFNLTSLTDKQCQTCHVSYMHSFEKDHPEFTNWPFQERSNIAFDHVSHGVKHFVENNKSFNCRQCHIDGPQGNVKLVASFELTCAECHQKDIIGDSASEFTFFKLPLLDVQALTDAGHSIGSWPAECDGDFDGDLPATMVMLLMSDSVTASIIKERGDGFSFSELDPTDARDVADAAVVAWSIKELLYDLSLNGERAIHERLKKVIGSELSDSESQQLAHGLHGAIFGLAQQQWIPELLSEVADRKSSLGQWKSADDANVVFARPNFQQKNDEVLAVNPLTSFFSNNSGRESVETPALKTSPMAAPPTTTQKYQEPKVVNLPPEKSRPAGDSGKHVTNSHQSKTSPRVRQDPDDGNTLLAENPVPGLLSGAPALPMIVNPNQNSAGSTNRNQPGTPTYEALENMVTKMANDELGGWYRNDQQFSISYRLSRHTDELLESWHNLAANHHTNESVLHSRLLNSLNSPAAAGQCRVCHTAEEKTTDEVQVNWSPDYRNPLVRDFTRFNHQPHELLGPLQDCQTCHKLDPGRSNQDTFSGLDSNNGVSNFSPILKANCASCHREDGAPSGCVDCHNYHVGSQVTTGQ